MDRFLQNWPYKLVALVTAVCLWAFVNSERNPVVDISRPVRIELRNLDKKSYTITSDTSDVDVNLEGPKAEVEEVVRTSSLRAWVDLQGRGAGTHTIPVHVSPSGSEKVTVRPVQPSVTITIESVTSRVLPIKVNFVSAPPVGYAYGEPRLEPSSATVSGRSSIVDNVSRLTVTVDPTTESDLRIDQLYPITALNASGGQVKDIRIEPTEARVRLDLVAVPAHKSVYVSPSIVGQPQFPYKVVKVSVNPEAVLVKGKPAALYGISTLNTEDVNIENVTGTVVKEAKLRILPGIEVEGAETVRVMVRIEMRQE